MSAHIMGINYRLDPTKHVAHPQEPSGVRNAKNRQASGKTERFDAHE